MRCFLSCFASFANLSLSETQLTLLPLPLSPYATHGNLLPTLLPPVEGISPNMTGHNLDLSRKVFQALTSNLKLGTTLAQWWLTEEKHRPSASLSSAAAAPTGKGDKAPGGGGKEKGEEEEGTVTIATAPNPPLETGGGSLHEEELSPNGISETNDY